MSTTLSTAEIRNGSAQQIAESLERDILARQMREGERYLSVREVADRFQVSTVTAHRGMKELARRQMLRIKRRSGSFIGPAASRRRSRVRVVHVIFPDEQSVRRRFLTEGIREGMHEMLPEASFQLNILPDNDVVEYLQDLCELYEACPMATLGAVLLRVPRAVRLFFAQSAMPAVVLGHAEEDVPLPSVDRDQYGVGHTAISYLLSKGHQRVALLMREQWNPGDNLTAAGAQQAVAQASGGRDSLMIQSVSAEAEVAEPTIRRMLQANPRPSAVACRLDTIATTCLNVAESLGLRVPEDLAVMSLGSDSESLRIAKPAVTAMSYDGAETGRRLAEFLVNVSNDRAARAARVELPSQLIEREST